MAMHDVGYQRHADVEDEGMQRQLLLISLLPFAGHLVEALMSKVAAQVGKEGDATPFIDLSYQKISDMLHQCGYQQRGWETMYNGHTGRQLKVWPSADQDCSHH